VRGLHASGREIPVELSVRAVGSAQGVIFVAFVRDITTRKAEVRQMQKARELAEAESARKARYAAFVSHEIRTPLNSLLLLIDLLRSPHAADEREELLTSAAAASEALLGIVNEVLDFSRLEAGAVSLASIAQSPARLVEQAAEIALPLARHRGNRVELEIDPGLRPVLAVEAGFVESHRQCGEGHGKW
jgi:signal transduction histidine kinase